MPDTIAIDVTQEEPQLASLSHQAYLRLRDKIITLQLPPSSPIDEAVLQDELGLGRTPVREALQRLSCEGLVVIRPRRGAFVASLSILDLQQIFELRRTLEGYAASLAADRATPADVAALQATLAELETTAQDDTQAHIDIDRAFHRGVARAAHNRFLEYTLTRMYNLNLRLWYLALDRVGPMRATIEEHRSVLDAIVEHDGARATQAMQGHISAFQTRVKDIL